MKKSIQLSESHLLNALQETSKPSSEIPYNAELLRKSLHLLALVIPAGMIILGKYNALLILVPMCALAFFLEIARVRSQKIANLINLVFGKMMRPGERPGIGDPVVINGATWVLTAATLLVLVFPVEIAASSMTMFMIGDAAAALIGRRFGRHNWGKSSKTIEGSSAYFVSAVLTLMAFKLVSPLESGLTALLSMILEIIPVPLNDNLYVPFGTALFLSALLKLVHNHPVPLFFG